MNEYQSQNKCTGRTPPLRKGGHWERIVCCASVVLIATFANAQDAPFRFKPVTVAENLPEDPYGIDIADFNIDRKPDILLIRFNEIAWYRAPNWEKHVIITNATKHNCYGAAHTIDRDGLPDVVVASDWNPGDTKDGGTITYARQIAETESPWPTVRIDNAPTLHRVRWIDTDGDDAKELVISPLKGPDDQGSRLALYRVPRDPSQDTWPSELIDDSLHITHAHIGVQFDSDKAEEVLVTAYEGIFLFDRGSDGQWKKTKLGKGEQSTEPHTGSSEVAFGKLKTGQRFIGAIEPWHGHEVVVYLEPEDKSTPWQRFMLDDTFDQRHGVDTVDLDGGGDDELVAGYRGPNKKHNKPTSLKAYDPVDPANGKWTTHWIDDGDMALEDVRIVDMNADGKPDIVAAGRATRNAKLYLNVTE